MVLPAQCIVFVWEDKVVGFVIALCLYTKSIVSISVGKSPCIECIEVKHRSPEVECRCYYCHRCRMKSHKGYIIHSFIFFSALSCASSSSFVFVFGQSHDTLDESPVASAFRFCVFFSRSVFLLCFHLFCWLVSVFLGCALCLVTNANSELWLDTVI